MLGRKGFIQLILQCCCSSSKEVRTGTQADQEVGADAKVMEGYYFLAPSYSLDLPVSFFTCVSSSFSCQPVCKTLQAKLLLSSVLLSLKSPLFPLLFS